MEVHKVTAPAAMRTNLILSCSSLSPALHTTSWVPPPQRAYLQHVQQRHPLFVDVTLPRIVLGLHPFPSPTCSMCSSATFSSLWMSALQWSSRSSNSSGSPNAELTDAARPVPCMNACSILEPKLLPEWGWEDKCESVGGGWAHVWEVGRVCGRYWFKILAVSPQIDHSAA